MAKQTDWTQMALIAAGVYLFYLWQRGELFGTPVAVGPDRGAGVPAGAAPPNHGAALPPGAPLPTPQPVPAPAAPPPSPQPPPAPALDRVEVRNRMLAAIQGDPFPKNLWRWSYYYAQVTGFPSPDIHWSQAPRFAGLSVQEVEQVELTIDEWLELAESHAVNPSGGTGGWKLTTGGFAGLAGVGAVGAAAGPWGQAASGQGSDWAGATPGYMSRGRELGR